MNDTLFISLELDSINSKPCPLVWENNKGGLKKKALRGRGNYILKSL